MYCGRTNSPEWIWSLALRVLGYQMLAEVSDWPERFVYYAKTGPRVVPPSSAEDPRLWTLHEVRNQIEDPDEMDPSEVDSLCDEISDGTRG